MSGKEIAVVAGLFVYYVSIATVWSITELAKGGVR